MTTKPEDPTRRKIVTEFNIEESSPVSEGGNQFAKVKIVRNDSDIPKEEEPKMTIFEKVKSTFGFQRSMDDKPSTMGELMKADEILRGMYDAEHYLMRSIESIMSRSSGADMAKLLRRTVEEFGTEMDRICSNKESMSRSVLERGRYNLTQIDSILSVLDSNPTVEISNIGKEQIERALKAFEVKDITKTPTKTITKEEPVKLEEIQRAIDALSDEDKTAFLASFKTPIERSAEPKDEPKVETKAEPVVDNRIESLERSISSLTELVSKLADETHKGKDEVEVERLAKAHAGLGQSKEELVETFRSLDSKGRETLSRALTAAKNQAEAGASIFGSQGRHFPSLSAEAQDVQARVERAVQTELDKNPKLTTTQARVAVWRSNPKLRQEYDEATRLKQ